MSKNNGVYLSFNWLSSDQCAQSDIVIVSGVLSLISILLSDRLKSIITNNLSESLESDGVYFIHTVSWRNLKSQGSLFVDWNLDGLGV